MTIKFKDKEYDLTSKSEFDTVLIEILKDIAYQLRRSNGV